MRDPEGRLRFEGGAAIRDLERTGSPEGFLRHPVARQLVSSGCLVPFEWRTPRSLVSPRYDFVSQPVDWSDAQFLAAAQLTLEVSEAILPAGFELKDASAWNIIFDGTRPVFCDHLSFQPIASREWWAFGQFCRHFSFPLAGARLRAVHARDTFLAHRDGLSAQQARALLGSRGLVSRLLPLLLERPGRGDKAPPVESLAAPQMRMRDTLHGKVFDYARRSLFTPRPASTGTPWSNYTDERNHYNLVSSLAKVATVRRWLSAVAPDTVLDLGCNTGEFSLAALDVGARVIAVDGDHDSVQRLFQQGGNSTRLHPVVANLADLHGGRGWNASEHAGLLDRLAGQADLTLMLALTHHLHFSEGIPLAEMSAWAAQLSRTHLILELLPETDPMVQRIAQQRRRTTESFTIEQQHTHFAAHFEFVERQTLPESGRQLALLRKRT